MTSSTLSSYVLSVTVVSDHTQGHKTHTIDRNPLDEVSACRRDNTQHSQETDIHVLGGIRTRNSSKQAAADPHLKQRGHRTRPK
jgi:hypothetical protein